MTAVAVDHDLEVDPRAWEANPAIPDPLWAPQEMSNLSSRDFTQAMIDLQFVDALLAASGRGLRQWQRWMIAVMRSRHPETGALPRVGLCLVPRRSGKTEALAALSGMVLLTQPPTGPQLVVLNVASGLVQADVLASRLRSFMSVPEITPRLKGLTETRGIRLKDGPGGHGGHRSQTIVSSEASANSHGGYLIGDELHLISASAWSNLLISSSVVPGREVQMADGPRWIENDSAAVTISTQGDESSIALARTLELCRDSATDPDSEFTYVYWRSPRDDVRKGDPDWNECLIAANPSVREGALDAKRILSDAAMLDDVAVKRYLLNLPVAAADTSAAFMSREEWEAIPALAAGAQPTGQVWIACDMAPDRRTLSIALAWRVADQVYAAPVRTIASPILTDVADTVATLARENFTGVTSMVVVVNELRLVELADAVNERGVRVEKAGPRLAHVTPAEVRRLATEGRLSIDHTRQLDDEVAGLITHYRRDGSYKVVPATDYANVTTAIAVILAAGVAGSEARTHTSQVL